MEHTGRMKQPTGDSADGDTASVDSHGVDAHSMHSVETPGVEPLRRSSNSPFWAARWLAVGYPLCVIGSVALKPAIPIPSALYPPAALEFAALMILPQRCWSWIALFAMSCDLVIMPAMSRVFSGNTPTLWYSAILSLITTSICFGMAVAVCAFRIADRAGRVKVTMIPALLLVLPFGALPGSLLTSWLHARVAHQPVMTLDVAIRCLSATLSVIALCPLVLGLLRGFENSQRAAAGKREQCAIGAAFAGLYVLYVAVPWRLDRSLELMLVTGPLLWLSLRCSHRAVATACAAVALGICVACAHGMGRFPPLVSLGTWRDGILSVQVFLLIICTGTLLINRFVLDQRTLLEDSKHKQAMLAAYGTALDEAEDAARRAAARDLHDGVAQIIAGQSMILGALRRRMRGSRSHELLDQAIAASREAQSAVRASIEDLSPPAVDRATPQEMLTWLTEHFSRRYGFDVHWRISGDQNLDHGHSRLMYKAIRELIYNAFKHSETDSVRVELALGPTGTVVSVSDSGVGFDPASPARDGRQHHGLIQLAERLSVVSGRLDILASAGRGCAITVFLPPQQTATRPVQPAARGRTEETIRQAGSDQSSRRDAAESIDIQT